MCSPCREIAITAVVAGLFLLPGCAGSSTNNAEAGQRVLRVCSDPNNLPFSNDRGEGFENRIAELVARDLDASLEYTWFAQRRGFIRNTLRAGACDVVIGVPANFELAATTRPYYRSTYVFLTREDRGLRIESLDDPALTQLEIGVHVIGDDYANTPPLHALGRRNIVQNVAGYSLFGDYSQPNPPARLVDAVVKRDVDVAIVWGPFAGFFGKEQSVPLRITPVSPEVDVPSLPFVFGISMGVRRGEEEFREELEQVLDRREDEIGRILAAYGVPVKPMAQGTTAEATAR
jgi:mxaJ protein